MLGLSSVFTVTETEYAIKFRLGKIVRSDYEPGLHTKVPFINNVRKFERRILTLDTAPEQMITSEQKFCRSRFLRQVADRECCAFLHLDAG